MIGAIAMTEPGAGSDLKAIRTRAERQGDHYLLNGQKTLITNGINADVVIVVATVAPELGARGLSLFCVDTALPGVTRGRRWPRSASTRRTPASCSSTTWRCRRRTCWAKSSAASTIWVNSWRPSAWPSRCARRHRSKACWPRRVAYVRERKVFGRFVIDYQNTRFVLADAARQTGDAAQFPRRVPGAADAGSAGCHDGGDGQAQRHRTAGHVLDDLLQLHGGYGYSSEYGIGRAWTDARALRIFGGSSEILREIIGRTL